MVLRTCLRLQLLKEEHNRLVYDFTDRDRKEQIEHLDKIDKVAEEIQKVTKEVNALLPHLR